MCCLYLYRLCAVVYVQVYVSSLVHTCNIHYFSYAAEEDEEARQRDELRYERHKERERKRRLEKSGKYVDPLCRTA